MLNTATFVFGVVLLLALTFEFINGFHDTANSIATSVSTRVLTPQVAIMMAASLNFLGALVSTKVARTISSGLISGHVDLHVIAAALIAAIVWNLVTWYFGLPSSSSHALIGALLGAHICEVVGVTGIIWSGVISKVIIPLFLSPIIGFAVGIGVMSLLFEVLRPLSQHIVNKYFAKLQTVSAAFMAFSHGSNDAQKTIGIVTLALASVNTMYPGELPAIILPHSADHIPVWIIIICAFVMAMGTSVGGWKIIKTMGVNMIKLQPIGGFAAETSAAVVIETASMMGAPVSTTHVISSTIMGVGAAKRLSAVRWIVARNVVKAWVYTIPVSMLLGAGVNLVIKIFLL